MIQQQTILKVADNSGAKTVKCIKVLGGFKKKKAQLGDVIIVSIQTLKNKSKITSKVNKGEVYKALIIRTKKKYIIKNGFTVNFDENSVSLLNKQNKPNKYCLIFASVRATTVQPPIDPSSPIACTDEKINTSEARRVRRPVQTPRSHR